MVATAEMHTAKAVAAAPMTSAEMSSAAVSATAVTTAAFRQRCARQQGRDNQNGNSNTELSRSTIWQQSELGCVTISALAMLGRSKRASVSILCAVAGKWTRNLPVPRATIDGRGREAANIWKICGLATNGVAHSG